MKMNSRIILLAFASLAIMQISHAQAGTWTWMHGLQSSNGMAVYGTTGVPAATNMPSALYESAGWTDHAGNFWLFGGLEVSMMESADFWRYDPVTNMWTSMNNANGMGLIGVYGVQGVGAPGNTPGSRGWGSATWVDNNGDLWLFGGYGFDGMGNTGSLNDLWKYNIAANEWTWMSGSQFAGTPGVYGTMGVPNAANFPDGRSECNATWVDAANNLWVFGGYGFSEYNDLWRYNTTTNEWTWMSGSSTSGLPPTYGTMGIAAPGNNPGGRGCYNGWQDCNGDFWLFGGMSSSASVGLGDLWKFSQASLQWTWMAGSSTQNSGGTFGALCTPSTTAFPASRFENRAAWTDNDGRFWNFGGFLASLNAGINDLWCYEPNTGEFTWTKGSAVPNQVGFYGTLGVAAPANTPGSRGGSVAFKDLQGNLWLFGGWDLNANFFNDLWKYTIDPACPAPVGGTGNVTAAFNAQPLTGCSPLQVTFNNTSSNATSYAWNFGDGGISFTTNPSHIYTNPGTYTVTLIAHAGGCTGSGTDTTTASIVVTQISLDIGPDASICPGDSLVLDAGIPGATYLWSDNTVGQTTTVSASGTYWVQVTDLNGCVARDSMTLSVISNQFSLGPDLTFCAGDSARLDAGNPGAAYLWSDASVTQTIPVYSSGSYWVQVTFPSGCFVRDTVAISVIPLPVVDLGNDITICDGASVALDAGLQPGAAILWSTSATSQVITVSTPGIYWAQATVPPACSSRDSIQVIVSPNLNVTLGNDTVICEDSLLVLDAGNPGSAYLWSNGATSQTITVSQAGLYAVTVVSPQSCTGAASIFIGTVSDFVTDLGPDTTLCTDDFWMLTAGPADLNYAWSTGELTPTIAAMQSGNYWVTVRNACYTHSDTIHITLRQDSAGPFVPSAFTPNGDGLNDVLKVEGLHSDAGFQMQVFDRWGMLIYETTDPQSGWDGKLHGIHVPEGVYALTAQVTDCRGKLRPIIASISLMR